MDIDFTTPSGKNDEIHILREFDLARNMLHNIIVSTPNISPEIRRTHLTKSPFGAIPYIDQYVPNEDKPIINSLRSIFDYIAADPDMKQIYDRIEGGEPIPNVVLTPTGKKDEIQTVDKYNRAKNYITRHYCCLLYTSRCV